ncbi:hypothetical protein GCM10009798_02870 [Nocardioides panacihumi]|uniref:Uncharacterized protein n=1 Tax=Nocardioides panacihumi TaxID=400774 RepID=A0ABP5BKQ2_9ACTN
MITNTNPLAGWLRRSRGPRVLAIVLGTLLATTATAYATTGTAQLSRGVRFYFGQTAGHGDSDNFTGYGPAGSTIAWLCSDANNAGGNNSYNAAFIRNKSLAPDVTLKKISRLYNQGVYRSAGIDTDSYTRYHTYVSWSAVPAAANSVSGFARDGFNAPSPC